MFEENKKERKERKINFVAYNPKFGKEKQNSSSFGQCSVSLKFGNIKFGKNAMEEMQMEGKFVKFYLEAAKKMIAWKIGEGSMSLEEVKIGNWRLAKKHKDSGQFSTSIAGLLKQFIGIEKESFTGLPIHKYTDSSLLDANNDYYYVQLTDKKDE